MSGHYDDDCAAHYTEGVCTQRYKDFWNATTDITTSGVVFFTGFQTRSQAGQDDDAALTRAQDTFLESVYCRAVDRFQTYVVELVSDIFFNQPRMIPELKISSREVFQAGDIEELRVRIVEEAASKYSYLNIVDLSSELEKKFNFSLFANKFSQHRTRRIVEIRNVLVHARGIVNRQFVSKVGAKVDQVGEKIPLPHPIQTDHYLHSVAVKIDRTAIEKFKLPTVLDNA